MKSCGSSTVGHHSPDLAACVVSAVSRLHLSPGPEDGAVTFAYPLVFSPQSRHASHRVELDGGATREERRTISRLAA